MQANKPTIPKGTRDFNARQIAQRNFIFDTIKQIYKLYGFTPLETTALENLSTLTGQYGLEGEQLIFKILNSGDFLATLSPQAKNQGYKDLLPQIAEKGLRYDLTVPLMRYVATNKQQLVFPFKRYQIQPVWRADRPQKGRFREFYQCDADVVGTESLLCEAEILVMAYQVLQQLGMSQYVTIQLNHRAILQGIAAWIGEPDKEHALCVAIDKLDKMGYPKVLEELISKGFAKTALDKLQCIVDLQGTHVEKLAVLGNQLCAFQQGQQGLQAIKQILTYIKAMGLAAMPIDLVPTLARGLAYYTGAVFEIKLKGMDIGSIGGGGRYDNLGEQFGIYGLTGVGFSFGMDRLYTVMEELNLFPIKNELVTQVMLTNIDPRAEQLALTTLAQIRMQGIAAELYPMQLPLKKQLVYANKKQIPFVVIIGDQEINTGAFTLKNMHSGNQVQLTLAPLIQALKNSLSITH